MTRPIPRCPNDQKAVYANGLCWTCFQAALQTAGGFDNFVKQQLTMTPAVIGRGKETGTMDDRIILPMNSKKHAKEVLKRFDEQGLHDTSVNVSPQIVKRPEGGYGIQVSQFDRRIMEAWRAYCEQYSEQD